MGQTKIIINARHKIHLVNNTVNNINLRVILFIFCTLLFVIKPNAQTIASKKLFTAENIDWSDFKGEVNYNYPHNIAALSIFSLEYKYNIKYIKNTDSIKINILSHTSFAIHSVLPLPSVVGSPTLIFAAFQGFGWLKSHSLCYRMQHSVLSLCVLRIYVSCFTITTANG